jgi:ABC-type Mn2+/Zn2+ transport system ATPase subunit
MPSVMALHVVGVAMSFGTEVVVRDASFVLNTGEKVGLVGENGVGKSTMLRIMAGQIEPDAGLVVVGPDLNLGYLAQEVPLQTSPNDPGSPDLLVTPPRLLRFYAARTTRWRRTANPARP